jgi:hypothetical protein
LRDPYPAFSAAICSHFTVAGGGGDAAGQTHSPTTARASMVEIVTSKADDAVMAAQLIEISGRDGIPREVRSSPPI